MEQFHLIFSIAFTLFVLMDSIGNIPIFISLLKNFHPKRQRVIIFRELLIALITIILFAFLGDYILNALNIKQHTVMVAGSIILFLISLKMIFPTSRNPDTYSSQKEPLVVPLAIPLIAGPAVLATVMFYSREEIGYFVLITAICIAWIASTIILLASSWLKKLLGLRGLIACERLMGLIIVLIAVEMFFQGIGMFICHPKNL